MRHWNARRLLPGLLDESLDAGTEAGARVHLAGCRRCREALAELAATEELLAQLPASLVPLTPSRAAESRLAGLARWATPPEPAWPERLGLSALGAFAAAALVLLVLTGTGYFPPGSAPDGGVTLAAVLPDSRLLPTGVR